MQFRQDIVTQAEQTQGLSYYMYQIRVDSPFIIHII